MMRRMIAKHASRDHYREHIYPFSGAICQELDNSRWASMAPDSSSWCDDGLRRGWIWIFQGRMDRMEYGMPLRRSGRVDSSPKTGAVEKKDRDATIIDGMDRSMR